VKPIDFRNETWASVQDRLSGLREVVYRGLEAHGPVTTLDLAARLNISGFSVRPRVTELCQLGLAKVVDGTPRSEGRYEAVPMIVAEAWFVREKDAATASQMVFRLGV